ncbi:prenyltransferase alpha subunit repeat protein [Nemania sp. FL0031]|nr:prenyltransferase alpha subunit repeat protein [Nemania sp. FL0031]
MYIFRGQSRTVRAHTRANTEEQRLEELEKTKAYRNLENQIRSEVASRNYGLALFDLTTKLVRLNPEYHTIWNIRRRCLLTSLNATEIPYDTASTHWSSDDAIPSDQRSPTAPGSSAIPITSTATSGSPSELEFIVPLLLKFPKSYCIWSFRKWILSQVNLRLPIPVMRKIWETELGLVSKMLTRDQRNFHAWGYRRFVVANLEKSELQGKSMTEDEFLFMTKMIKRDLSNFSAWHNRSQLIPRLLDERGADDQMRIAFLDEELAFMREALNVGPEDQSLWFYHSFLMSFFDDRNQQTIVPSLTVQERISYLTREIDEIKGILEDYPNIRWVHQGLLECLVVLDRLEQRGNRDSIEREDLKTSLAKVRLLDPMRIGRWNDWEEIQRAESCQ